MNYLNHIFQEIMIIQILVYFLLIIILYKVFLLGLIKYLQLILKFGKNKVIFIYEPLKIMNIELNENPILKKSCSSFQIIKKYPETKVIITSYFLINTIIIVEPKLIKQFVFNHEKKVEKLKQTIYFNDMYKGIILQNGEKWHASRKLLSSVFHIKLLKQRQLYINQFIAQKILNIQNQKLDLNKFTRCITSQIISQELLGKQFNKIHFNNLSVFQQKYAIDLEVRKLSKKLSYIIRQTIFGYLDSESMMLNNDQRKLFLRFLHLKQICKNYIRHKHNIYKKDKSSIEITMFLKAYFDSKQQDLYQQIAQQFLTIIFANQDTTPIVMTNCLYILIQYPQYQQILLNQFKSKKDFNESKKINDFIRQSMRLYYPIMSNFRRHVNTEFEIQGFKFKQSDIIDIGIGFNMLNPKYFQNPQKFDLMRYKNDQIQNYTNVPFYYGDRNCLGQHMGLLYIKLFLKNILQNYRIIKNQGTNSQILDSSLISFIKK